MPIKNDRQLRVSKEAAEQFRKSIGELDRATADANAILRKAMLDGMQSQLQTLEDEIDEYERGHDDHGEVRAP